MFYPAFVLQFLFILSKMKADIPDSGNAFVYLMRAYTVSCVR